MVDQVKWPCLGRYPDEKPYQHCCRYLGYGWQFEVSTTFLCLAQSLKVLLAFLGKEMCGSTQRYDERRWPCPNPGVNDFIAHTDDVKILKAVVRALSHADGSSLVQEMIDVVE